jgi:hypothetical protein
MEVVRGTTMPRTLRPPTPTGTIPTTVTTTLGFVSSKLTVPVFFIGI